MDAVYGKGLCWGCNTYFQHVEFVVGWGIGFVSGRINGVGTRP